MNAKKQIAVWDYIISKNANPIINKVVTELRIAETRTCFVIDKQNKIIRQTKQKNPN